MASGGETTWPEYFRKLQAYLQWQTAQIAELQRTVAGLRMELAAVKEQKGVRIDKIEYSFDQLKVEKLEGTLNIGVTPSGLKSIEEFAVNGQTASIGGKEGPVAGVGPFPDGNGGTGGSGTGASAGSGSAGSGSPNIGQAGAGPGYPGGYGYPPPGFPGSLDYRGESANAPNWIQEIGRQVKSYLDEEVAGDLERWVEQQQLPLDPEARRLVLDDIRSQLDDRVRHYARETGNRAVAGQSFESVAHDIIERTKRDIRTAIDMYVTGIQPSEEEPR